MTTAMKSCPHVPSFKMTNAKEEKLNTFFWFQSRVAISVQAVEEAFITFIS